MTALQTLAPEAITLRIATVRSQRVIVDADLAALYGVQTKRFNEVVKRNLAKFPADFMFTLTAEEFAALRSQFATYRWLLHWGDEHLPREQHFKFQSGGANLNLSLIGLLENTRQAASAYLAQLNRLPQLTQNYDAIATELSTYEIRIL